MPDPAKPEALERKLIYRSRWVNLYVDRVRFPNGKIIEQHHLLDFDYPAVMAIAQDPSGRYLMVKVCRYATGRAEWEFPAGMIEDGETPTQAAAREVLEETGYHTGDYKLLYAYNPMNGIANKVFYVVRCQVEGPPGGFDTQEINEVSWFTEEDVLAMIHSGEMKDGYCLTSFFLHKIL